jgi:hypothetical protein
VLSTSSAPLLVDTQSSRRKAGTRAASGIPSGTRRTRSHCRRVTTGAAAAGGKVETMATKIFCDFCEAEIPDEVPSKKITVCVEAEAEPARAAVHRLRKDACFSCGDRIRRILSLGTSKQIEQFLESVTRR